MKKIISGVLLFAILAVAALALVSCAPNKDPNKAAESLEDAGYVVTNMTKDGVGILSAYKKDDMKVTVFIMYCADDELDEEYEEAKAEWDEMKDKEEYKDYDFGKSGNMIYMGHKDAIKAAR